MDDIKEEIKLIQALLKNKKGINGVQILVIDLKVDVASLQVYYKDLIVYELMLSDMQNDKVMISYDKLYKGVENDLPVFLHSGKFKQVAETIAFCLFRTNDIEDENYVEIEVNEVLH